MFEADDGPFHAYRRTVSVDQDADPPTVTEFEFLVWGALFVPLFKRWLRERRSGPDTPWWSPPDRWDARTSHVVALLAVMTLIAATSGPSSPRPSRSLPTSSTPATATRVSRSPPSESGVLAFVVVAAADRRGRRLMLVVASIAACLLAATGGGARSRGWAAARRSPEGCRPRWRC